MDTEIYYANNEYEKVFNDYLKENGIDPSLDNVKEYLEDTSGTYKKSIRSMLFPGGFKKEVRDSMITSDSVCANPECDHTCNVLTLDHITPVSKYFNDVGYKVSEEERMKWYNNPNNLQVLCKSCNSKKGGERYNPKRVMEALGLK